MQQSLIPAKSALILWGDDAADGRAGDGRINELRVFAHGHEPAWTRRLPCSRGACCAGWMAGSWRDTPRGLFLELVTLSGFESNATKIAAIREFAKIEGQHDWTSDLLRELNPESTKEAAPES